MWSIFNQSPSTVCACTLCDSPTAAAKLLCPACERELPWLDHSCWQCATPLPDSHSALRCGQCQITPPPFERTISLFHYRPPADYLLQQLKFNSNLAIARHLGELLLQKLEAEIDTLPQAIIPVPLHPSRLRERGFNQAQVIAEPISRKLSMPLETRACVRISATRAQSDLPASERQRNIRDAFWVSQPINASHVAIVDDVMTTGATVSELAKTLRNSGVKHIEVWTLARAGY